MESLAIVKEKKPTMQHSLELVMIRGNFRIPGDENGDSEVI